jgi:hypothetical protein
MDISVICSPAKLYFAFSMAYILFNFYLASVSGVMVSIFYAIFGTLLLWILCAAKMDFVAWGLLGLPVLFYILLFAIMVFDRSFLSVTHEYKNGTNGTNGTNGSCQEETECNTCEPTCE